MLKKAAKEQEAADLTTTLSNTTTTMMGAGDVTINMTSAGLNRRSLLNELENKIGEIEKIKENEQQASTDDEQDHGLSNDANNDEPAEKGLLTHTFFNFLSSINRISIIIIIIITKRLRAASS